MRHKLRSLIGFGHVTAGNPSSSRIAIAIVWLGTRIAIFPRHAISLSQIRHRGGRSFRYYVRPTPIRLVDCYISTDKKQKKKIPSESVAISLSTSSMCFSDLTDESAENVSVAKELSYLGSSAACLVLT